MDYEQPKKYAVSSGLHTKRQAEERVEGKHLLHARSLLGAFVVASVLIMLVGALPAAAAAGKITRFKVPTAMSFPNGITSGPDGALWFTSTSNNSIDRITDKPVPHVTLSPATGPPSTVVQVTGTGFGAFEKVKISYIDSTNGTTALATVTTSAAGTFTKQVTIPSNATAGSQHVQAKGITSKIKASPVFMVT